MKTVYMIQTSPYCWKLETASGVVIQDYIQKHSLYDAEQWVKQYISSFACWTYVMKPKVLPNV